MSSASDGPATTGDIGQLVWESYLRLDKNGKPNSNEWTTLAAIVERRSSVAQDIPAIAADTSRPHDIDRVVALATGTKCVTGNAASLDSDVVIDCHAESLAKRAFKRYLISSLRRNADFDSRSFHLFISVLPCGSIFRHKGTAEDAHEVVGIRRKPGRGEPCPKPSCADKIAKWLMMGLQGRQLITFTGCIRLSSITIGNCVENIEFDRQRLLTSLLPCWPPLPGNSGRDSVCNTEEQSTGGDDDSDGNQGQPPRKRVKTLETNDTDATRPAAALFAPPSDLDIFFEPNFRREPLTRTEARKAACPAAIVAWFDVETSTMCREVIVRGRRIGSGKKSSKPLLVCTSSIRAAINDLSSRSHNAPAADLEGLYHDAWLEARANLARFAGWPCSSDKQRP